MIDIATKVAGIRATYGPEERRALAAYGDVHEALEEAGLHPYIETRGGLAVCAYTRNGTLLVVASEDFLPLDRGMLMGWHLTHVPEDEPGAAWRCVVYDTVPTDLCCDPRGELSLTTLIEAAVAHLAACTRAVGGERS
ncbi:hypothetical protein [Streptomyces noursei]|uniref:hypothetical protein n=1 Tax=Streptomyces noursei TaxID=1971 RepID=UPI00167C3477|nr:hypothetical protein [Streptomyces noursei]MCZ1019734.1 hypothetical protein [Streptomyces noursei]GGX50950.1 hypothetical protein GCM10010341_85640 [Streptomyces noursei]